MKINIIDLSILLICNTITNIINNDLLRNSLSRYSKVASVRPIFKKDDITNIKKL